ncbi:DUF3592 domain-containing protein [Haloarcula brevis]|uniref:DUF3592 domain-containing protein n=1 Tax=Haloarcula brevis TaxID=3111453 RepID=UPI00300EEB05
MADDSGVSISGPDSPGKAVLYVLVGLAIAGYGGFDYVQQTEAVRNSVEVDATIVERGIETDSGTSSNPGVEYEPTVAFEYTYDGTDYTGTKLYPADIARSYDSRSEAESVLEPYERGTRTTAYVSPDDPSDAFLKNETSSAPIVAVGLGALFALLGTASAVRQF